MARESIEYRVVDRDDTGVDGAGDRVGGVGGCRQQQDGQDGSSLTADTPTPASDAASGREACNHPWGEPLMMIDDVPAPTTASERADVGGNRPFEVVLADLRRKQALADQLRDRIRHTPDIAGAAE